MQRIVLDSNVVLSGLLWRGPPHALLEHVGQHADMHLFSSQTLLDELADVLTRSSITKRLQQINKTAHAVLTDYVQAVTVLQPPRLPQPVCRDPDDDAVLALALMARADVIVSGDNDLLVLQRFEGISIISVKEALVRLEV